MTALDAEFNAELTEIFREESTTRLDQMDAALLAMESGNADAETIDSLFRNAHTIKGSAGILGFEDIRSLGHAVEDFLSSVRETGVFPPELAEPLMRATAGLRAQVSGTAEPIAGLLDDLAASVAAYRGGDIRTGNAGVPGAGVPGAGVPGAGVPGAGVPGTAGVPAGPGAGAGAVERASVARTGRGASRATVERIPPSSPYRTLPGQSVESPSRCPAIRGSATWALAGKRL